MPNNSEVPSFDAETLDDLRQYLGAGATHRGEVYAANGQVSSLRWSKSDGTLHAVVQGSVLEPYVVTVEMTIVDGRVIGVDEGFCTCPVGTDCKHVAAAVFAAMNERSRRRVVPARWSDTLAGLTSTTRPTSPTRSSGVGLQLGLAKSVEGPGAVRVMARPVQSNERGAWVSTGISWNHLPYTSDVDVKRQVDVLRELYSLYLIKSGRGDYYYRQPTTIDLAEASGRTLWELLDTLVARRMSIVHPKRSLTSVIDVDRAEFEVDITTSPDGHLAVGGRTRVGGEVIDPSTMAFLGEDGHGLVHWAPDAPADVTKRAFRLTRLTDELLPALQPLAIATGPLVVPPADRALFSADYLPAIRRRASVVSSDSSYREPVVTGPDLWVSVAYEAGHRVTVSAQWVYEIDGATVLLSAMVPSEDDGTRATSAEALIMEAVAGVLGVRPVGSSLPSVVRSGMAAATLLNESVPAMEVLDHVRVDVLGEPPDFSDVSDEVAISFGTRAVAGESDWFDLAIDMTVDGTSVALAVIISAIAQDESHLLLADGRYFDLHTEQLTTLRRLIEEARALQDSPTDPLRLSRFQAGLWEELTSLGVVKRQAKAWRRQVSGLLEIDSVAPIEPSPNLDATLRAYQQQGLSWLSFVFDHGLGGILADDMGLGKTLQTLALIQRTRDLNTRTPPFLIVAPTSVVHNWAREAARFAPTLEFATASKTAAKRGHSIVDLADGADVLVTSYTIFRIDYDDFESVPWAGLILDEAQYVKNHHGKSYQCVRKLPVPFKLAITGTPMENNVMELWALLSITSPGLFPSPSKFTDTYRRPIEVGGDSDVLAQLRRRIRPLVLRRTKELVAPDLPPKQEQTVEVDLYTKHRRLYDTTLNRERQKVLGLLGDLDRNRFTILKSLTLLRQLSLDAALIDEKHASIPSAKTDELVEQLAEIAAGQHRALVFSQFTRYLGRVRDRLGDVGIGYEYLDGNTRNRGDVVARFRDGSAPVFLISLKAGGVGLTLTEADYCFVLDPWWNPATEAQAVDRAHRIGQDRTVFVNRLVSRGTIEEKVMAMKERKAKLFSSIMDDGGAFGGQLTADDIRGLVS